jgi:hypothetical protein
MTTRVRGFTANRFTKVVTRLGPASGSYVYKVSEGDELDDESII